jgi:preprotein translocase subunit SecB
MSSTNPENQSAESAPIGFRIVRHYLNDLSVENPVGYLPDDAIAELSHHAGVSVACKALESGGLWQVEIGIQLAASHEGRTVFLLELNYRVDVAPQGIPDPVLTHVLRVEVPTAAFPVIKEIIERNGAFAGYPGIELQPFDFRTVHYGEA